MTAENIQESKEKIAQLYIDSFKQELTIFQVGFFSRFEEKIKKLLLSSEDLGDSFQDLPLSDQEKALLANDPLLAEKAYLFIKEKREKIATATTNEELENLGYELVEEHKNSPIKNGIITSAVGGGVVIGTDRVNKWVNITHTKKMKELFPTTKIETTEVKTAFKGMEQQFESLSKNLDTYSKNPKLTKYMKANLKKSADVFKKTAAGLTEESVDAFEMWSKMGDKLPYSVIKSINPNDAQKLMGITGDVFERIQNAKDANEIRTLLNVGEDFSEETIKVLKGAKNLDEFKGMAHCLTQSKAIKTVLKGIRGIALLDLICLGIDVWSYGDNMNEVDEIKKINEIRAHAVKNRAERQLGVGIVGTAASIGVAIIASCTAIGSIVPGFGTIVGLAVGAIAFGVTKIVDVYYDKKEFYAQNENDYRMQYRTEIKQAIIQTASAESFGWNENMRAKISIERAENGQSINLVKDAWSTLIWQEEMEEGAYPLLHSLKSSGQQKEEFKKTLTPEELPLYEEEEKKLQAIIDKRLEYIQQYMYETGDAKKINDFVAAMKGSQGIAFVEKVLAESKTYYLKSSQGEDQFVPGFENKSIDEYKTAFGDKLKEQDPIMFEHLTSLCEKDFTKFMEIYQGSLFLQSYVSFETPAETPTETVATEEGYVDPFLNETALNNEEYVDPFSASGSSEEDLASGNTVLLQKNIDYIKRFYQFATLGVPIEHLNTMELNFKDIDYNYVEKVVLDITKVDQASVFTPIDTKIYFSGDATLTRGKSNIELSGNTGQDVMYRLAKEMHGYIGNNDMLELMQFYSPDKANSLGIYYDGVWRINNDRAIDKTFDLSLFDDPKKDATAIMKELISPSMWNLIPSFFVPNGSPIPGAVDTWGFMNNASSIDTKTENMDEEMNKEFRSVFGGILQEQKGDISPEHKKTVEQDIISYVKTNIEANPNKTGYVELPYYLVIEARKSGIGDVSRFLFSYRNGSLILCGNKATIDTKIDFSLSKIPVIKEYVQNVREEFTPEEKAYIAYVEDAHKRLEELRNVKGMLTHEDELDLPKDFEVIISDKWKDWEYLKKSMLACDPTIAVVDLLKTEYKGYHDYFENMYIALLSQVSSFKMTNDIDSHAHIMSLLGKMQSGFFDAKDMKLVEGILPGKLAEEFTKQLQTQKIDGKTIMELYTTGDEQGKEKAMWGAKQILTAILEAFVLSLGDDNSIKDIKSPSDLKNVFKKNDVAPEAMASFQQQFKTTLPYNLEKKEFFVSPVIDTSSIKSTPAEKLKIKEVTEGEKKTMDISKDVLKAIEDTAANVVWQGRRGDISFDPEKNTLTSWSNTTKIASIIPPVKKTTDIAGQKIDYMSGTIIKIEGLSMEYSLYEGVKAANLINFLKDNFKGKGDGSSPFNLSTRGSLEFDHEDKYVDTEILDAIDFKDQFPTTYEHQEAFVSYLNSLSIR